MLRVAVFRVFQLFLGWGCCSTRGAEYRHKGSTAVVISFGSDGSVFFIFFYHIEIIRDLNIINIRFFPDSEHMMCDLAEVTATYVALIQILQWGDKCDTRWQRCAKWHPNHASAMQNGSYALLHLPSSTQQHTSFTHMNCIHLLNFVGTLTTFDNSPKRSEVQNLSLFTEVQLVHLCFSRIRPRKPWLKKPGRTAIPWEYSEYYKNIRENAVWQFGICSFDMFWYILTSPCFPCLVRTVPMFPHVPPPAGRHLDTPTVNKEWLNDLDSLDLDKLELFCYFCCLSYCS